MKIDNIEALSLEIVSYMAAFGYEDANLGVCTINRFNPFWSIRELPRFKRYRLANYNGMFDSAVARLCSENVIWQNGDRLLMGKAPASMDPCPLEVRCETCGDVYVIEVFTAAEIEELDMNDLDCSTCGKQGYTLHKV